MKAHEPMTEHEYLQTKLLILRMTANDLKHSIRECGAVDFREDSVAKTFEAYDVDGKPVWYLKLLPEGQ